MAVTYVGAGSTFVAKATTPAFTISTGAVTAGNVVVLRIGARATGTSAIPVVTATDSDGNTWSQIGASSVASTTVAYLWAATMGTSGTFTVTVNLTNTPSVVVAATDIFSGVTMTTDGGNTGGSTTSVSAVSAASFTTASAGDLVVAAVAQANVAATLSSLPTGWAAFSTTPATTGGASTSNNAVEGAYLIQAAAGATAFSGSITPQSAAYSSAAAALTASGGTPAATRLPGPVNINQAVARAANY